MSEPALSRNTWERMHGNPSRNGTARRNEYGDQRKGEWDAYGNRLRSPGYRPIQPGQMSATYDPGYRDADQNPDGSVTQRTIYRPDPLQRDQPQYADMPDRLDPTTGKFASETMPPQGPAPTYRDARERVPLPYNPGARSNWMEDQAPGERDPYAEARANADVARSLRGAHPWDVNSQNARAAGAIANAGAPFMPEQNPQPLNLPDQRPPDNLTAEQLAQWSQGALARNIAMTQPGGMNQYRQPVARAEARPTTYQEALAGAMQGGRDAAPFRGSSADEVRDFYATDPNRVDNNAALQRLAGGGGDPIMTPYGKVSPTIDQSAAKVPAAGRSGYSEKLASLGTAPANPAPVARPAPMVAGNAPMGNAPLPDISREDMQARNQNFRPSPAQPVPDVSPADMQARNRNFEPSASAAPWVPMPSLRPQPAGGSLTTAGRTGANVVNATQQAAATMAGVGTAGPNYRGTAAPRYAGDISPDAMNQRNSVLENAHTTWGGAPDPATADGFRNYADALKRIRGQSTPVKSLPKKIAANY